ncbi:MAG: DNA primase DnaG [Nanoarchaeota archaeon]|nr:DNA primase [Nanoarchaeota archaeon]MBU4451801.1 DNA primase [Nanoarchaeota archaeon]MCG2723470.1 DNA primase [archaeon]
MAKLAQTSVKYLIKAKFDASGIVEKPDVIGALFGQTEGLLGPELDLRELQRTGRIGRIEVKSVSQRGKAVGEITIPSSLDSTETALIAASLETIDRVGPCDAKIHIESVEDLRTIKRNYIVERAKELLAGLLNQMPDTAVMSEELMQNLRTAEVVEFKGLPAGPDVLTGDAIIVCEGRADVVNLLKHGVKNAVAIGGTSVPQAFAEIFREKEVTVFLDGDRGGDIILKELQQLGEIDFVARAPEGKEVEELTKKEIFKALRDKVPTGQATDIRPLSQPQHQQTVNHGADFISQNERAEPFDVLETSESKEKSAQFKSYSVKTSTPILSNTRRVTSVSSSSAPMKKKALDSETSAKFKEHLSELVGTRAAAIFDKDSNFVGRVPVKEITTSLKQIESPSAVILDGYIDKFLVKAAEDAGVQFLIGTSLKDKPFSSKLSIISENEL